MQTSLNYKDDYLCVVSEFEVPSGGHGRTLVKEWYPVHPAEAAQARAFVDRPVTVSDAGEGIYVDEDGNVYQLADKGETKPIAVEQLPGREKTELEVLLESSLKGKTANGQTGGVKRLLKRNRKSGRKQQALQMLTAKRTARPAEAPPTVETRAPRFSVAAPEEPVRLNLRQKLAEVRRRIGYIQKRGHNERFNYSYVTAADIAGSAGDLLAELAWW